jgi:hypothetical protein
MGFSPQKISGWNDLRKIKPANESQNRMSSLKYDFSLGTVMK